MHRAPGLLLIGFAVASATLPPATVQAHELSEQRATRAIERQLDKRLPLRMDKRTVLRSHDVDCGVYGAHVNEHKYLCEVRLRGRKGERRLTCDTAMVAYLRGDRVQVRWQKGANAWQANCWVAH